MAATAQLLEFGKISCYSHTPGEANHIYNEIFEDKCYDLQGLPDSPYIIDVGANIGLFTLFMKQKYPSAKILAFEPAPRTFNTLRQNLNHYDHHDVQVHCVGLASQEGTAKFTFFPNLPGNSTLKHEEKQELYDDCIQKRGPEIAKSLFGDFEILDVKLQRLSHYLGSSIDIPRIDLLKIDVEGAELEVLRGLDDSHWRLVQNVFVEVWEASGSCQEIEDLLRSRNFTVVTEVAPIISRSRFFMITATR